MKTTPITLALLCILLAFASTSLRAETIRFGQKGQVTITPPKGWQIESRENAFGPGNHFVTLIANKSRKPGCTIMIAAGERQPAQTEAGFLAFAGDLYAEGAGQFVEKTPSFKKLNINNGIGYYSVSTYAAMVGKPPAEGTAKVHGCVLIYRKDSPLVSADLYVDDPKDPALDQMVKAVREMKVSFPALPANLVQFDKRRSIKIDIPPGWGTLRQPGNPLPDTVGTYNLKLLPPADVKAGFTITIGKLKTGKPFSKQQFEALAQKMASDILPGTVEKEAVFSELQMRGGRGLYCLFTDASLVGKPPVPRDYKYLGLFLANYDNGCVAYATALADDKDGAHFKLMSEIFASVEPAFDASDETPPVQTRTSGQGTIIGNATSSIRLLIPSTDYIRRDIGKGAGGGMSKPGYFIGNDGKAGVALSGWFEQVSQFKYKDARQMWARDGLTRAENVEYRTINDWEVIMYDFVFGGGSFRQANMRANFIRDDVWIDLHLSKTGNTTSAALRDALVAYLNTLKIIKTSESPVLGTATIPFGANGSLKIDIPDTWQTRVAGDQFGAGDEAGASYTVALDAGAGARFSCKMTFIRAARLKEQTQEQWLASVRGAGAEYAGQSVEKNATLVPIDIKNGHGVYFILTDASLVGKTPPPGEYKIFASMHIRYDTGVLAIITAFMDDANCDEFKQLLASVPAMEPDLKIIPPKQTR